MKLLASALVKLQADLKNPAYTKTVDMTLNSGRRVNYSYAELSAILDLVRPAMLRHGLTIVQTTEYSSGELILKTRILHESGEFLEGSWPLPVNAKAQEIGSAITYSRRYTICAMLGLQADSDDDGEQAKAVEQKPREKKQVLNHAPGANSFSDDNPPWPGEEDRAQPTSAPISPGFDFENHVIGFGKHSKSTLGRVGLLEAKKYREWLRGTVKQSGKPMSDKAAEYCAIVDQWEKIKLGGGALSEPPTIDPSDEIPF